MEKIPTFAPKLICIIEKIPMDTIDFKREIIFSSSNKSISHQISKAEKEGKIKKIAPRIYSANLRDSEEYIIKRHLFDILKWRLLLERILMNSMNISSLQMLTKNLRKES